MAVIGYTGGMAEQGDDFEEWLEHGGHRPIAWRRAAALLTLSGLFLACGTFCFGLPYRGDISIFVATAFAMAWVLAFYYGVRTINDDNWTAISILLGFAFIALSWYFRTLYLAVAGKVLPSCTIVDIQTITSNDENGNPGSWSLYQAACPDGRQYTARADQLLNVGDRPTLWTAPVWPAEGQLIDGPDSPVSAVYILGLAGSGFAVVGVIVLAIVLRRRKEAAR